MDLKNKKIDNFIIGNPISTGGFGTIYSCIDLSLKRKVAIKFLNPEYRNNSVAVQNFIHEAETQGQLHHCSIVSVHSFVRDRDLHYIVLEFIEGSSIKEILEKENRINLKKTISYTQQILRGLSHAHSKNIIHFDIKPGNILITHDDRVKISDFGISHFLGVKTDKDKEWFGTPLYASPEQLLNNAADFRSDIYSLGITVFKMLCGSLPFSFDIDGKITKKHILTESDILIPEDLGDRERAFIDRILLKAIRRNVDERYQSAYEMLEIMDDINESI